MNKLLFILLAIFSIKCATDLEDEQIESLYEAIKYSNSLKNNVNQYGINIVNNKALQKICSWAHISIEIFDCLRFLISKGIDLRLIGDGVLYYPCICDRFEILDLLIENGANINFLDPMGNSYLCIALDRENYDIAKYLIIKGIDTSRSQAVYCLSHLHIAALSDNINKLNEIVSNEAIVESCKDVENKYKYCSWELACIVGNIKAVKFLLKNRKILHLDINKSSNNGSILHLACRYNYVNIVKYLLNNKEALELDINCKDNYGETALFKCRRNLKLIKLLVSTGIDLSSVDSYGCSILDSMIGSICVENIVKYLIINGAVSEKYNRWKDLIERACIKGDLEFIEKEIAKGLSRDQILLILENSIKFDNLNIVKFLIENSICSKENIQDLLNRANGYLLLSECSVELIKYIINLYNGFEMPYGLLGSIDRSQILRVICDIDGFDNQINRYLLRTGSMNAQVPNRYHNFSDKVNSSLSALQNMKNIKQQIKNAISSNDIDSIRELHDLDLFFTESEIVDLILSRLNSIDENTFIELIRRVNLSFDLTELIDSNGENILTCALIKNKIKLSLILIYLNRSLLDYVNWGLCDNKILHIYNIIQDLNKKIVESKKVNNSLNCL